MPTEQRRTYNCLYMRRWRFGHPETAKALSKEASAKYRQRHAKKNREYQRLWMRNWYLTHPEEGRERSRLFAEHNPHKKAFFQLQSKMRLRGLAGEYTLEQWLAKVERHNWRCFYCGVELTIQTLQADHKTPIARGGSNFLRNVVPCCKSCNTRKHTMTASEFNRSRWITGDWPSVHAD